MGSHVVDQLVRRGAEVTILDDLTRGSTANLESALQTGRVRLVNGDICDRELVLRLTRDKDLIFHLAALRITQCAVEPRRAFDVMFSGSFNVLEAAVQEHVKKIVASSSASVYGLAGEFPTPETQHPYGNRTLYGTGKLALEGMLRSFNDMYGLDYVALRYFNVYGPRMDLHGRYTEVLVRWLDRIDAGDPPVIFGDANQSMDMVYVGDVARANVLAAEANATDEAFNIGSGREVTLEGLARTLMHELGRELPILLEPARSVNPVPRRLADISAARSRLGFAPETSLGAGLSHLIAWRREQVQALVGPR